MNIVFALLFGAGGAAAGWLVLRIVNHTTARDGYRPKKTDVAFFTGGSAGLGARLSLKFGVPGTLLFV